MTPAKLLIAQRLDEVARELERDCRIDERSSHSDGLVRGQNRVVRNR